MDRNLWWGVRKAVGSLVALRKESVDRNRAFITITTICIVVALRKESVDRNLLFPVGAGCLIMSLSARRAWIEILIILYAFIGVLVALRKESVDRNNVMFSVFASPFVALRKESVDRNPSKILKKQQKSRRSPQGERG